MSGGIFIMGQPDPPTPEQQTEAEKRALRERAALETKTKEALPLLAEARKILRRIESFGVGGSRLATAREQLALLEEEIETFLVRPVETSR